MSWASRRRATYGLGTVLFFLVVIGGPFAYHFLTVPATCEDGIRNQGETSVDKGGPCPLLDAHALSPYSILWSRSFRVRDGSYSSVAYIQNPNADAGASAVEYKFGLYDEHNVLVAEKQGTTILMPGAITPVFEGGIDTGHRIVAHTYFEFLRPVVWERLDNAASVITIGNRTMDTGDAPRISAVAKNTSVRDVQHVTFIVTVSDPSGNAFAASQTTLDSLPADTSVPITFTWPQAFNIPVGSVDITPLVDPEAPRGR